MHAANLGASLRGVESRGITLVDGYDEFSVDVLERNRGAVFNDAFAV
ncbi:MAG: hypothetical protein ACREX7_02505 [Casimicrobiaceae bacterium]